MAAADLAYIALQPAAQRPLLRELRAIVKETLPGATVSIKWAVPFYAVNGKDVCALAAFKQHVAINFFAPPRALSDPKKRLEGAAKHSLLFKVRTAADIDRASIARWLEAASRA